MTSTTPEPASPTVALDQSHWIRLARAANHPGADAVYTRALRLAADLRKAGEVRFPLTADRYWETWIKTKPSQRLDVARLMAELSGYETMLNLDTLTVFEIEAALRQEHSGESVPLGIEVFDEGINHAWGMEPVGESLRIAGPTNDGSNEITDHFTGQARAVFRRCGRTSMSGQC